MRIVGVAIGTIVRVIVGTIVAIVAAVLAFVGVTLAVQPRPKCEEPTPREAPGEPVPGCYTNPLVCVDSEVWVELPIGTPAQYAQCGTGTHTLVRAQAGFVGFDAGARTELRFAPSSNVSVQVVHFSSDPAPGVIEAMQGASIVATRPFVPMPGVLQQYVLPGAGIDRVVVRPQSQSYVTLVVQWCH